MWCWSVGDGAFHRLEIMAHGSLHGPSLDPGAWLHVTGEFELHQSCDILSVAWCLLLRLVMAFSFGKI